MTEDEAKTKWCPFVRFVPSSPGEHEAFPNRPVTAEAGDLTRCIASACMAWRWGQTAGAGPFKLDHGTGYCGLAGSRLP